MNPIDEPGTTVRTPATASDFPPPTLSVVVPFYNEEAVARGVVDELCHEMSALGPTWEAILVDDGSTDRTGAELAAAGASWSQCRVVTLPHNSGQGAALRFGIEQTHAPVIALMDGDGQNVPGDIGLLVARLDHADLVVGVRTPRHDSWLRRRMSRLANAVRRRLLRDGLSDAACALKVFRRELLATFPPTTAFMFHPYLPAFAVAGSYRVTEQPVRHRPRPGGRSKYGLGAMLWRPLCDTLAIAWRLRRSHHPTARDPRQSEGPRKSPPAPRLL